MESETITVRMENGQNLDVVVLSRRVGEIEVVLGEGAHSVRCKLTPTRNENAYVGTVMGREIVYEQSTAEVKATLDKRNPHLRSARPRR